MGLFDAFKKTTAPIKQVKIDETSILLYTKVISKYEQYLENFTYNTLTINNYERVYIVEDTFVIYVGLIDFSPSTNYQNYTVVFEELLDNPIFKFNFTAFCKDFPQNEKGKIFYKRFHGIWAETLRKESDIIDMIHLSYGQGWSYYIESKTEYVDKSLPELNLRQRFDNWEGYLHHFIIYELSDGTRTGHSIYTTKNPNIHKTALEKANDLEFSAMSYFYHKYVVKLEYLESTEDYQKATDTMMELMCDKIKVYKENGWEHKKEKGNTSKHCIAEKDLKYFWVSKYVKNTDRAGLIEIERNILSEVYNGKYSDLPRYEYLIPKNKWKSEQLVYEYACKLYKKSNVIYQHRPFFLRSNHGQMSYDVFVSGLNVAIEYQGKQHFEPVEIFGGEESYKTQVIRDELKKKLSEENGITLVYINYDEDISTDLIKEKVETALQAKKNI